jgi:hypothetical protein
MNGWGNDRSEKETYEFGIPYVRMPGKIRRQATCEVESVGRMVNFCGGGRWIRGQETVEPVAETVARGGWLGDAKASKEVADTFCCRL